MRGSAGGWCGALSALWILALPLAVAPWFHSEFAAPKTLLLAAVGIPLALLLLWQRRNHAVLAPLHLLCLLLVPLACVSTLQCTPDAAQLAAALMLLAAPLVALQIGAGSGGSLQALRALARALGTATLLVLAVGLVRRHTELLGWIPDRADVAFSSTLGNSNEVAEFAAPIAVLLLLLPGMRFADAGLALTALVLSGLSESRAGLLAITLGLLAGSALLLRTRARHQGQLILGALLLLVLCVALLPNLEPLRARALSAFDSAHPTNAVRLELFSSTLDMAVANLPFGVGPGRFEAEYPRFRSAAEWHAAGPNSAVESPHNEVLFVAAEGGVLGLALCAGIALLCFLRWRRLPAERAEARGAILGVVIVLSVFALVRSPFHHPCGTLAAGLCVGWLFAAGAPSAGPTRLWIAIGISMLLLAALLGAALHTHEDWLTGRARRQLSAFDHHVRHKAQSEAMAAVQDCADTIASLAAEPFGTAHAYRAALVARELAALGIALENVGTRPAWLGHAQSSTRALIAHVQKHDALHLPARLLQAEELLRIEDTALVPAALREAEQLLRDTIKLLPQAPGTREVLAEILLRTARPNDALRLLREEAEFATQPSNALLRKIGSLDLLHAGHEAQSLRWLLPYTHAESPLLEAARAADVAERSSDALDKALCILAHDAIHPEALDLVIRHGFAAQRDAERLLANRATARAKLALALQAINNGDSAAATRNLQLALSRDSELAPAHLLSAHAALLRSDSAAANAAITTLRTLGLDTTSIRTACNADPVLAPALQRGLLDPALR
ncbi:MAG: hypothetical protein EXS14_04705 [Planctomycetes bacterium]|nr:hypothetical protein [Planctomycetota bacterium]